MYVYYRNMKTVWDEAKNRRDRKKHGVSFETAQLVFSDPRNLSIQDRFEDSEERWQTLGSVGGVLVLLVAHTVHEDESEDEAIRIISARKATRRERLRYEQTQ